MSHWNVVSVWLGFMLFFNLKMISWWHWNVPFFPHLYLFLQFNLPSIILRWDQVFNQSTQQQQLQFYFIWKINENWQKLKKEFKKYWFGISFSRTIPRAKTVQRYALHNIAVLVLSRNAQQQQLYLYWSTERLRTDETEFKKYWIGISLLWT